MAASSTYKSFLMHKATSSSSYTKLIDIKDYPALGGAPEMLETTTLSDKMQTYILGIQSLDALEFTANYDPVDYKTLNEMAGTQTDFAIWFGGTESGGTVTPTGDLGAFSFKGALSVYVDGGSVNAVRDMKISIAPSTVITFAAKPST